ncbi:OB-fold domain-containing protein [Actinoplanes sp. NPDC051851]|uniref:Zn-ribbon domain-containing OB-fold protein n=1 Tax=Actinoplanes sp. NPDC051851 TaxID=3154753 RepID=UPI00342CCFBD
MMLQICLTCRRFQHHPRPICLACGSSDLSDTPAAGTGVVDSFTVIHRAEQPYILARVRLTEGPIVLTHLIDDPNPACDQPVRLDLRDGLAVFRPVAIPPATME